MEKRLTWLDVHCHVCGEQLNSWDKRCSDALGYENVVCESCIATEYDQTVDELRHTLEHHFGMLPCISI